MKTKESHSHVIDEYLHCASLILHLHS